jgi:hypothetical protein
MPNSLLTAAVFSTLVLSVATQSACTAAQDKSPGATPAQESAPAKVANPMATFARMVGGEWKLTSTTGTHVTAGTALYDTWHWGPGKHSLRVMTDGIGGDVKPWRALRAVYWHPGRKQVRSLELSPFRAGVAEGTIKFDGEASEAIIDMYQTGDHRKLKARWTFDGPDKYHDELLESTGPEGYFPLAAWDRIRIAPPTTPRPRAVEGAKLPERLKAFEPLLSHTWETEVGAKFEWATGGASHIRSTFEWVPLANGIYMRTLALSKDAEPTHLLDAYVYHHTGAHALRCLALSNRGGVYEGDITVKGGGALQLDLKGYEGDRVVPHDVRFDFEKDGTLRHRVWSLKGTERSLMLDVHHKKVTAPPHSAR